jgi:hypothetical protein
MIGNTNIIPLSFNGFYGFAVAVQRQRAIYTENSGFASPTLGQLTFPRFVAIGFYFLSLIFSMGMCIHS